MSDDGPGLQRSESLSPLVITQLQEWPELPDKRIKLLTEPLFDLGKLVNELRALVFIQTIPSDAIFQLEEIYASDMHGIEVPNQFRVEQENAVGFGSLKGDEMSCSVRVRI